MSGWNGKIKCVNTDMCNCYTKDKVYEVVDGSFVDDDGYFKCRGASFKEFCSCSYAKWELVETSSFHLPDLKDGMIVELNNGDFRLMCDGCAMGEESSRELKDYNDKLEYIYNCDKWHIKSIYTRKVHYLNGMFDKNNLTLIWERESEKSKQIKELNDKVSQLKSELSDVETKLTELN